MEDSMAIRPSEPRSTGLSEVSGNRAVAISGWQLVREMLPAALESDEAFAARIGFLEEVVDEVGPEAFIQAVRQAIRTKKYRSEVSIACIRECAGLSLAAAQHPAVSAWEIVTDIVRYHVERVGEGGYRLVDREGIDFKSSTPDKVVTFKKALPEIPENIQAAVDLMGGWGALADSYPQWWGQRWQMFREFYRPKANACTTLAVVP